MVHASEQSNASRRQLLPVAQMHLHPQPTALGNEVLAPSRQHRLGIWVSSRSKEPLTLRTLVIAALPTATVRLWVVVESSWAMARCTFEPHHTYGAVMVILRQSTDCRARSLCDTAFPICDALPSSKA